MKINVLELIPDMGIGGAQSLVRDYARLINKSKYNLFIATVYPTEMNANVDLLKNSLAYQVSLYSKHNLVNRIFNRVFNPYISAYLILRIIEKYNINVIHVHLNILKLLLPIRHRIKNVKLIYTCHSLPQRFFSGNNASEFRAAKLLIEDNNLQLVALHEDMRKELNQMFNINNTIVIHNGIDFDRFKNVLESKNNIRKSLNIPKDVFLMGHVGRLSPEKNHLFLLDVFHEVHEREPKSYLLLVGGGPQHLIKEKIKALNLEDFVIMLSNRSDIPQLIKAMDVFVFPSLFEGLPLSVVEAQVAGLRVVVSNSLTEECFFLPSLVTMDLNDSPSQWANAVLDDKLEGNYNKDISLFDAKREMLRLEHYYALMN